MTFLPNYLDKFREIEQAILFHPNTCGACRYNDEGERKYWEKFKATVEYIARNDRDFFNYCYGTPISGYERDMKIRWELMNPGSPSKDLKRQITEAELRQRKARELLRTYIFKTE